MKAGLRKVCYWVIPVVGVIAVVNLFVQWPLFSAIAFGVLCIGYFTVVLVKSRIGDSDEVSG